MKENEILSEHENLIDEEEKQDYSIVRSVDKRANYGRRKETIFYVSLIALPFIHYLIFYVYVNLNSVLMAFKEIQVVNGIVNVKFGFSNFIQIIEDVVYGVAMKEMIGNSLLFYVINLVIGLPLALFFSFYVYKKYYFSEFFRVMLFLPSIVSAIVLAEMYTLLFSDAYFDIMAMFGVEVEFAPIVDPLMKRTLVIVFNLLLSFGTNVIMYASAMTRIPVSVIEYAELEGVSPLREFWSITLPLVYPTITTFLVVGVTSIFTNQMNLYAFYGNNAGYEVKTIGYELFRLVDIGQGISSAYYYPAALGLLCTFIVVPITLIVKSLLNKFDPDVSF